MSPHDSASRLLAPTPMQIAGARHWYQYALEHGQHLAPHYIEILRTSGVEVEPRVVAPVSMVFELATQEAPAPAEYAATPVSTTTTVQTASAADLAQSERWGECGPQPPAANEALPSLELPELRDLRKSGIPLPVIRQNQIVTERGRQLASRVRSGKGIDSFLAAPRQNPLRPGTTTDATIAPIVGAVYPCAMPGQTDRPYAYRVRMRHPHATENPDGSIDISKYESRAREEAGVFFPATAEGLELYTRLKTWDATEGEKKALVLGMCGLAAIGATGIEMLLDHEHVKTLAREHLREQHGEYSSSFSKAQIEEAKKYVKRTRRASELWRLHPKLMLLIRDCPIDDKTLRIGFDHWLEKKPGANGIVDEVRAAVRLAGAWYRAGGACVVFVFPRAFIAGEQSPKGWDDLYLRAGLHACGLTLAEHNLDVDAAEALDLEAGKAEVLRQLHDLAIELPRDRVCGEWKYDEREAALWVQSQCGRVPRSKPFIEDDRDDVSEKDDGSASLSASNIDFFDAAKPPAWSEIEQQTSGSVHVAKLLRLDARKGQKPQLDCRPGKADATARELLKIVRDRGEVFATDSEMTVLLPRARSMKMDEYIKQPCVEARPARRSTVKRLASRHCEVFVTPTYRDDSQPGDLPDAEADAALELAGESKLLRPLCGLVEVPIILADGRVVEASGYDVESGVHMQRRDNLFIPVTRTPAAARDGYRLLRRFFGDVGFVTESDAAVVIAFLLTVVGRWAITGRIPMFGVFGNDSHTAKTLVTQVVSVIATGFDALDVGPPQQDRDTNRIRNKRFAHAALQHRRVVRMDELSGDAPYKDPFVQTTLSTGHVSHTPNYTDETRMITFRPVLVATGTEISLSVPMANRTLVARTVKRTSDTELKHSNLAAVAAAKRPQLVHAALEMLGHQIANKCQLPAGLAPMGDAAFNGEWSALVRG